MIPFLNLVRGQLVSASRKHMWNKSTNKRITNLIRSIVETGVLSAAAAFLDLGLFMRFPHNNLHIAMCAFSFPSLRVKGTMPDLGFGPQLDGVIEVVQQRAHGIA
jgi:hypothetical protein